MGYREQKNKVEQKVKRLKRIFLCVFVALLLALFIFSFFYPPETWKYYFSLPKVEARQDKEMRVHYIDVGQGDCILIELPDGKTMLVDGGDRGAKTEKTVLRYLNALKIDVIDYLVITHKNRDHCGAIGEVVRTKKVLNAYLPMGNDSGSGEYTEAYAELSKADCALFDVNATVDLSQDGDTPYTLSFLYPYSTRAIPEGEKSSAVFWLDYMGVSFLFTGDAPSDVEKELVRNHAKGILKEKLDSTEILKVGHHGSVTSSCEEFLKYLNLQTAILSCGENNSYGHPADSVMENLSALSTDVYRTDKQGNIVVTVDEDGKYTVSTQKS